MWTPICGWCAVIWFSVPKLYASMGFDSEKMGEFILAIFGHNKEIIRLCLLLFMVVSLNSKAERYSSIIFLHFILKLVL